MLEYLEVQVYVAALMHVHQGICHLERNVPELPVAQRSVLTLQFPVQQSSQVSA